MRAKLERHEKMWMFQPVPHCIIMFSHFHQCEEVKVPQRLLIVNYVKICFPLDSSQIKATRGPDPGLVTLIPHSGARLQQRTLCISREGACLASDKTGWYGFGEQFFLGSLMKHLIVVLIVC